MRWSKMNPSNHSEGDFLEDDSIGMIASCKTEEEDGISLSGFKVNVRRQDSSKAVEVNLGTLVWVTQRYILLQDF